MEYRKLGTSSLEVSCIGFGCWGISGGPMWGPQDESESVRALQTALDQGVTFFDTAEGYGAGYSEEVVGKALAVRRDEAIVASKVLPENLDPVALRRSCENSLRRLSMDCIDLYQIHWPTPPGDPDAVVETLTRLRSEGKIRHVGVSNFGPPDLEEYPDDLFVSNQIGYNLLFRAVEYSVIPATILRGMSIISYSTLLHGILGGDYRSADDVPPNRARTRHFSAGREQVRHGESGHEELTFSTLDRIREHASEIGVTTRELAVKWVLSRPNVATVLIGSRSAAQARENAALGRTDLPPETIVRLDEITTPLKEAMGPNPDMWQAESRIRW